jgi:hypothetical protein
MISRTQFSGQSMTVKKQAMPEMKKFDGPASLNISGAQNMLAANSNKPIAKPGFGS